MPLSCLRLLVSPLRLVSAAIWETVQRKDVFSYGMVDDFVTAVTEIVPELLGHRQRRLLSLGLRAQACMNKLNNEVFIGLLSPTCSISQTPQLKVQALGVTQNATTAPLCSEIIYFQWFVSTLATSRCAEQSCSGTTGAVML